jgi:hypothetical protein
MHRNIHLAVSIIFGDNFLKLRFRQLTKVEIDLRIGTFRKLEIDFWELERNA